MPFSIVRDELARQVADVVVVPANAALRVDGGAGLAVGRVAGLERLQAACDGIGGCDEGNAVVTPSFAYPAKALVHAVGPVWDDSAYARDALGSAYENALRLAVGHDAKSIALPLISAGARGCPADYSLHVALDCVKAFLEVNDEVDVRIVVFDDDATRAARSRFEELACFIDDAYVEEHQEYLFPTQSLGNVQFDRPAFAARPEPSMRRIEQRESLLSRAVESIGDVIDHAKGVLPSKQRSVGFEEEEFPLAEASELCEPAEGFAQPVPSRASSLGDMLDSIDAPFSTTLLAIIDERGLTDAEVYRRANISRQHFSKMRSNPDYQPTKKTVLALAVALELSLEETRDLLERAGFALSHSSKLDLVIEWFITQGNYDVFSINEALYHYDLPLLGQ